MRVNVTVSNGQGFAGQPDQSLDVVLFWIAGIFEYDHIPTLGVAQHIAELVDQNTVTIERAIVGITR